MLVMIEKHPEIKYLRGALSNRELTRAINTIESMSCPVLYDIETGVMSEVKPEYTFKGCNLKYVK